MADETPVLPENPSPPKYVRLSLAEYDLLARLRAAGRTEEEIARVLHRAPSTIHEAGKRLDTTPDLVKALMAASSTDTLASWKKATRKAAARGDHRPAREWLEMAHPSLRAPTNSHLGGGAGGVTIVIGVPGAPLALPDITIQTSPRAELPGGPDAPGVPAAPYEPAVLSPVLSTDRGETDSNS